VIPVLPAWRLAAACREEDSAAFFPDGRALSEEERTHLTAVCDSCTVRACCDEYATEERVEGWWAGSLRGGGRRSRQAAVVTIVPASVEVVQREPEEPLLGLGFSAEQASQARALVRATNEGAFALGDVLVAALGKPGEGRYHDGSRARIDAVAEALGCNPASLRRMRSVAATWAPEEREPRASWAVHQMLRGHPERVTTMAEFVRWAGLRGALPSNSRLTAWLAWREGRTLPAHVAEGLPEDVRSLVTAAPEEVDLERMLERLQHDADALARALREHPEAREQVRSAAWEALEWLSSDYPALTA